MATLIAIPARSHAQSNDSVVLRFAWAEGLIADVTTRSNVMFESMAGMQNESRGFSYEMLTQSHADGLRVDTRNFDFGDQAATTPQESFVQRVQSMRPTLIVGPDGDFVGLEGLEEIVSSISSALDSMPPTESAALSGMLGDMDEDFWISQATVDWNTRVGMWAGKEFVPGQPQTVRGEQLYPMFGDASLPVTWELEYQGRVACVAAQGGDDCVTLVVRTIPDGPALTEAMRGFMADVLSEMGPAGMEISFEIDAVSVDSEMVMIVEAATLLPHSVTMDLTTTSSMSIMGQSQDSTNRNRDVMTYVWRR